MKCDVCGKESELEAAFFKERKAFRKTIQTFCPACWARRRRKFDGWILITVIIEGIIGYAIILNDPSLGIGQLFVAIFFLQLFSILALLLHELGHGVVARLCGWRVFAIYIGSGKRVFKFRLLGTAFNFHLLPVGGATLNTPTELKGYRTKRFLIVLAGPAVNAVAAGLTLIFWWGKWRNFNSVGVPPAAPFFILANVMVVIINLVPHRLKRLNIGSDGKQLYETIFKKPTGTEPHALRFAFEGGLRLDEYKDIAGALDWCNQGLALYPKNFELLNLSGLICLGQQNYRRAREIFVTMLSDNLKSQRRNMALNNIAYTDALMDEPELLPEADAYSKEIYAATPWIPYIAGTRGTVLVAMGRFQEGIQLLKESLEKEEGPRGKSENACHLAIGYARMGNQKEADNYLKLAQLLDPQCPLIGRAKTELGQT